MSNKYTSFEQLDRDIKRAWLQSEIDKEEMKLSLHETKDSFTPSKIVTAAIGGAATGGFLLKLVTPLISFAFAKLLKKYR